MSNWRRFPLFALVLLGIWLLLNQALTIGHVILGGITALAATRAFAKLQEPGRIGRRIHVMAQLVGHVLIDIVRSNVAVARIVLGLAPRPTSGFLDIPLELRDPRGLAVLATIITATPGTVWVRYERSRGVLNLHILDLADEAEWIGTIKGRYERQLQEIFE